ncbi:MAG: septal ring lytic transglycosylase RlpA family protein [Pseudomonadota bacterium]
MSLCRLGVLFFLALLVGCSAVVVEKDGPGSKRVSAGNIKDAVPKSEPRSKYGNPKSYEVFGKRYYTLASSKGFVERGVGSWYGKKFHGRKTSSGEIYDMYQMTAAHKQLPLPTYVEVRNLENGRSAIVKVNDRGPFHGNRIIDLSYAAALKLGYADKGTAMLEVVALDADGRPNQRPQVAKQSPGGSREVYLQIGAFGERTNAERLHASVSAYLTEAVRIAIGDDGGRPIYRVQVGPIFSVSVADRVVSALSSFGIEEHHFVAN